ncbi:CLYBL [Branchiostoma lanceolatum]|uniref:CLYBL protein n=1 Tax=Branchiostoma lanceolatum TaxID=7740 RepID=A0A8J9ZDP3_BRALA|nr:CLYBL [Branchiostoma lanceolatum]
MPSNKAKRSKTCATGYWQRRYLEAPIRPQRRPSRLTVRTNDTLLQFPSEFPSCIKMALISRLTPHAQNSLRKMMLTTPPSGCLSPCRGRSSVASPLMRSVLFLKNSPECLQSFSEARADAYIMDLEDAVPKDKKDPALKLYADTLKSGIFRGKTVYVRLSDINDEAKLQKEVDALCHPDLTGFIVPKVTSCDDIKKTDDILSELEKKNNLLPGHCKIAPILETLEALWHAPAIAKASPRLSALINGRADIAACFRKDPLSSPIGKSFMLDVLHAARAAGIPALDGVTYLDNFPRLERDVTLGKTLGFEGMLVVHPSLVPFVNQLYSPTRQEREWAEQVTAGVRVYQRSAQEYRQFIGPPHRPCASHILETHRKIQALEASVSINDKPFGKPEGDLGTVTPLKRKGGLGANPMKEGAWVPGILPVTLDSSWRASWNSSFLNARRLNSDDVTAREMGLPGIQPPFHLLATLALSLAVSKSSEIGRFGLGISNAVQLKPVVEGDTVRPYFSLDRVEEAGNSGKYAIVTSSHVLVNQRDEVVFRATKPTMYPRVATEKLHIAKERTKQIPSDSELRSCIIQNAAVRGSTETTSLPLEPNKLHVHRMVKVFSPTESKGLSNLIRATNEHHLNIEKFTTEDLVVAGPLVEAATVHNVADDFGDILYEEVVEASNVNRVNQEDMVGSISFIHNVHPLPENPDLEEVTVRTLGIKNLDVDELMERDFPVRLFHGTNMKTADYEEICREEFPLLYRRIAAQVLWKFLRLRPAATNEAPAGTRPEFS